jgi:hypothetical protein
MFSKDTSFTALSTKDGLSPDSCGAIFVIVIDSKRLLTT